MENTKLINKVPPGGYPNIVMSWWKLIDILVTLKCINKSFRMWSSGREVTDILCKIYNKDKHWRDHI